MSLRSDEVKALLERNEFVGCNGNVSMDAFNAFRDEFEHCSSDTSRCIAFLQGVGSTHERYNPF